MLGIRLRGGRVNLAGLRLVDMPMEPAVGAVFGDSRGQAGGRLKPVVEVMAEHAPALLVEVIGIIADVLLAGRGRNEGGDGLGFHRLCRLLGGDIPRRQRFLNTRPNGCAAVWGVTLR